MEMTYSGKKMPACSPFYKFLPLFLDIKNTVTEFPEYNTPAPPPPTLAHSN